jgi:hypothetical protein
VGVKSKRGGCRHDQNDGQDGRRDGGSNEMIDSEKL